MAQETNILVQVSDDGASWTDLVLLNAGTVTYKHTGLALLGTTKYYRTIAKGDGINTLDSPPSQVVSVATGFSTQYQAVLDQMTTDGVSHPSFTQNVLNDIIVRNLLKSGKWDEFDYLHYFEQEVGTPYEALTYNWIDPTKHRLTNLGANLVDFTAGQGLSVTGGNDQYMNLNFTPSTDAVKGTKDNCSLIFKAFGIPGTYVNPIRILGGSNGTNQVNIIHGATDNLNTRYYEAGSRAGTTAIGGLNSHFQLSRKTTGATQQIFKDGAYLKDAGTTGAGAHGLPSVSLHLFGLNLNGTHYPSEGGFGLSYIAAGSSLLYEDNLVYKILNHTYNFNETSSTGVSRFTTTGSASPSLYMPHVMRADKFPEGVILGVTKKYIILYSTDHANPSSSSKLIWGQADHPDLSGFEEKGVIISQYQSETPHLEYVPNDPDGHVIHLYYHPDTTHPDSGGSQQTRLLTAPAGTLLHDINAWTDRGKVLGITAYETANYTQIHTGYLVVFPQEDGTFVGVHSVQGNIGATAAGVPKIGISTASATGRDWTRTIQELDVTSFMPYYRQFHHTRFLYFTRGANQYVVGCSTKYDFDFSETKIGICLTDGNYNPVSYLGNISGKNSGDGCSNAAFYIEGDTLHIYYIMNQTELFHTTWDLKNLD